MHGAGRTTGGLGDCTGLGVHGGGDPGEHVGMTRGLGLGLRVAGAPGGTGPGERGHGGRVVVGGLVVGGVVGEHGRMVDKFVPGTSGVHGGRVTGGFVVVMEGDGEDGGGGEGGGGGFVGFIEGGDGSGVVGGGGGGA